MLSTGVSKLPHGALSFLTHIGNNLYIGTSGGVLLHYVSLPASEDTEDPARVWIQASTRSLSPLNASSPTQDRGVKQILLLPRANKAFVLCTGHVTIYSLPELTPTLTSSSARLTNCTWLGGVDNNNDLPDSSAENQDIIMICQKTRLRIVRIGERLSQIREIGLGDCLTTARRGDIACIADRTSYSLLDLVEQQRIGLFDVLLESTDDTEVVSVDQEAGAEPVVEERAQDKPLPPFPNNDQEDAQSANEAGQQESQPNMSEDKQILTAEDAATNGSFPPRQSSLARVVPESNSTSQSGPDDSSVSSAVNVVKQADKEQATKTFKSGFPVLPIVASPTPDRFLLVRGTSLNSLAWV